MFKAIQGVKPYKSEGNAQLVCKKLNQKGDAKYEVVQMTDCWQVLTEAQIEALTAPPQETQTIAPEDVGSVEGVLGTLVEVPVASQEPVTLGVAPKGSILVPVDNVKLFAKYLQTATGKPFMGEDRWWKLDAYPGIVYDPSTHTAQVPMTAKQIRARKGMELLLDMNLPVAGAVVAEAEASETAEAALDAIEQQEAVADAAEDGTAITAQEMEQLVENATEDGEAAA